MPSMKDYAAEQLWNMHPKDFQPLLDAFFDKAVQYPTEENVADYYKIQDIARSRANAFANVATLVWQKHPELNTLASIILQIPPARRPGSKCQRTGKLNPTK